MYLTTITHEGHSWMVELKVMPDGQVPGRLKFAFVRAGESQGEIRYTWEVSAKLLEALRRDGELSEEVLHQQLARRLRRSGRSTPAARSFPRSNGSSGANKGSTHNHGTNEVLTTLAGKMRKHRIRVLEGDTVSVEVSPYDFGRGRITYRFK